MSDLTQINAWKSVGARLLTATERLGRWAADQLAHPKTRTAVIGLLLIIIGAVFVTAPFWTFWLVVVGVVMVLTSWVGSRLEGRFAIEWSDAGAGFEMRARFKSASTPMPRPEIPQDPRSYQTVDGAAPDLIDGAAHTVELNLDELKALIAAVEQTQTTGASGEAQPTAVAPAVTAEAA